MLSIMALFLITSVNILLTGTLDFNIQGLNIKSDSIFTFYFKLLEQLLLGNFSNTAKAWTTSDEENKIQVWNFLFIHSPINLLQHDKPTFIITE